MTLSAPEYRPAKNSPIQKIDFQLGDDKESVDYFAEVKTETERLVGQIYDQLVANGHTPIQGKDKRAFIEYIRGQIGETMVEIMRNRH
jgi:uncharacterized protein (DUF342 family)